MTKRKHVPLREPEVAVRPIPGFEGRYSVSRDGRVWSHAKTMGLSRHGGRWLRAGLNSGYKVVSLFKDEKQHMLAVHRAVALAWLPNPDNLPEVNHLNGAHGDCSAENLEWCTKSGNAEHAWRTGLNTGARKIDDAQVAALKGDLAAGMKQKHAAVKYGVTRGTVSHIVNGRVKYATRTPQQPASAPL